MSVCLSVCLRTYLKEQTSKRSVQRLPKAVERSSSGGVVRRYVLPVLWMTIMLSRNGHALAKRIELAHQKTAPGRSPISKIAFFKQ